MSDKIKKLERSVEELYRDDPERADVVVFGRKPRPSRRGFLGGAGLAAFGAAVGGTLPFSQNIPAGLIPAALAQDKSAPPAPPKGPAYLDFPGKDKGLVVIGEKPLVAETPEHLLNDDTTPIEKFYIRNNGQIPDEAKDPDKWVIKIEGEVNKPLEISLGELKSKYKAQTLRMVLECGGNGRSFFTPRASGNQWTNGGAGCAEWTGVRLADLLKAAGLKPSGIYTAHYAADLHLSGEADRPTLSRGVRLAKAMEPESMIVWGMNGKPLPNIHGGPVRLVIPGWAGSASQKWLTRIVIRDKEHDGPGMTGTSYRLAIKPMVPGDKADPKNFRILEIDADTIHHHSARQWREARRRKSRRRLARRIMGGRSLGAACRHFHRLRPVVASCEAGKAEEQVRLAAMDRQSETAFGRLLRDLVAGNRQQRDDAAACGAELESKRLRRKSVPPHCGARRLIKS